MARIRSIKPEFFKHDALFDAEIEESLPLRLAFAGLWCVCDREGRFKWRPKQLKIDILPYDDIDFSRVLDALMTRGFIEKYENSGAFYGYVPSWSDHQVINNRESDSTLPNPEDLSSKVTRGPRVIHAYTTTLVQDQVEGKGKERKGKEWKGETRHGLVDAWNEMVNNFHEFSMVMKITDERRRAIANAKKKDTEIEIHFRAAVAIIPESDFLSGKNKTGWTANFDWALKNYLKIIEGNYKNRSTSKDVEKERELLDIFSDKGLIDSE